MLYCSYNLSLGFNPEAPYESRDRNSNKIARADSVLASAAQKIAEVKNESKAYCPDKG